MSAPWLAAAALATLALGAGAQKADGGDDPPKNDPSRCTVCAGDPEAMEAFGVLSHGGFEFGRTDTPEVDAMFPRRTIVWVETEHFELGFSAPPYRPTAFERQVLGSELELSGMPYLADSLLLMDPWFRAHLFARRCEATYARVLEVLGVEQDAFPSEEHPWDGTPPYRGEGPHLGHRGKFEVLVLPGLQDHLHYLSNQFGISVPSTTRWNIVERDTLALNLHLHEGELREDLPLHGAVVHNLGHLLLNAYEHFSYRTPTWLHLGLAHALEREVTLQTVAFCADEGTPAISSKTNDWTQATKAVLRKKDAPTLERLLSLPTVGAFGLDDHLVAWSMVRYLLDEHPEGFAALNAELHGRLRPDGSPDSEGLADVHRDAFREHLGMGYREFNEAWRAWAKDQDRRR